MTCFRDSENDMREGERTLAANWRFSLSALNTIDFPFYGGVKKGRLMKFTTHINSTTY